MNYKNMMLNTIQLQKYEYAYIIIIKPLRHFSLLDF
jgi:hypothetical protein